MKVYALLFLLILTQDCATRRKSESGNTAPAVAQESLGSLENSLGVPDISMDSFSIGTLKLARLTSNSHQGPETYYNYKLCDGSKCPAEGKLLWGSVLLPTLAAGTYDTKVMSCIQGFNPPFPETCKHEVDIPFTQVQNPNDELYAMVLDEWKLGQEIKSKAAAIQDAMASYPPPSGPPSAVDQSVQAQLSYGPDLTAEMINSSYYAEVADTAQAAASTNPSTDTSTAIQAAQNKAFEGAVLVSLGAPVLLMGIVIGGISWYIPGTVKGNVESFRGSANESLSRVTSQAQEKLGELSEFGKNVITEGNQELLKTASALDKILISNDAVKEAMHYLENGGDPQALLSSSLEKRLKNMDVVVKGADIARNLAYGVVPGFSKTIMIDDLKQKFYTNLDAVDSNVTDHQQYKAGNRTFIHETKAPFLIYELNNGLLEIPQSKESNGKLKEADLTALSEMPLNDEQHNQLSPAEKYDYEKTAEGYWKVKSDAMKNYIVVDGRIYRKTTPYVDSIIPKLSPQTMQILADRRAEMQRAGKVDADSMYGHGIPLFDEYGRLVEPPAPWRVEGKNWPKEIREGTNWVAANPLVGHEAITINDYEKYGISKQDATFPKSSVDDTGKKIVQLPNVEKGLGGNVGAAAGWALGLAQKDPFIMLEIPLRQAELDAQKVYEANVKKLSTFAGNTSGTLLVKYRQFLKAAPGYADLGKTKIDEMRAQGQDSLDDLNKSVNEEIDTHSKNINTKAKKIGSTGMKVGRGLAAVGAAAVLGGPYVNYLSLQGDPSSSLRAQLAPQEQEIAELNKARLGKLSQINTWLKAHNFPIPDAEWIYHLQ